MLVAEIFTEEDEAEMRKLEEQAFLSWNRRDFQQFVKGVEKHGRLVLVLTCYQR